MIIFGLVFDLRIFGLKIFGLRISGVNIFGLRIFGLKMVLMIIFGCVDPPPCRPATISPTTTYHDDNFIQSN